MDPSFSLQLSQRTYSRQEILAGHFDTNLPHEKEVLTFCRAWLQGQEHFIVHTSGSTGTPKPIGLSRRQMEASAQQTLAALGLPAGASALLCMNPAYIGGKMMLVRAMEGHMQLKVVEVSADPLAQLPTDSTFHFTALVPLQLEAVLQNPHSRAILNKAKSVLIGGAAVSPQLRQTLQPFSATAFYSTYGMTETVSHIALQRLNGAEAQDFFQAFPDVTLGQDTRGCLSIQGAVTANQLLQTNDVVMLLDSHRFRWLGRADHIINSGGIKIQLEKTERLAEKLLLELGHQRNLFAWGLPHRQLGQQLVLLVQGPPLPAQTEASWKQQFRQQLVKYEQPKAIYYIPQFKLTPSGKIQKAETAALVAKADI